MKYINIKNLIISSIFVVIAFSVQAQKTAIYDQPSNYYQSALSLFNKQQFGASQHLFKKTIDNIEDPYSILRINAEYYNALCAVELFNDDGELLLLNFIEDHPESMHIKYVYFQLGVFQYRKKAYSRALKSFRKVDIYDLTKEAQIEFHFKRGYAYFKRDSIEQAKSNFFEIINKENKYQPPAMYYYSHIAYVEGNYETALKGFLSLKDDAVFKPVVPYYVTHIYYMQKRYDELLKIAPKLIETSTPKRQPEIARLIGEAYFRTGRYKEAIPYLERYYKMSGSAISATNKYQMAYCYYNVGEYDKAIPYFQAVNSSEDNIAQNANYHLAMCYVRTNNKAYALEAFKEAYQNNKDASITEDALYNFAKLSYELDYNPYNQALKAFETYVTKYPNSQHREEAMGYLTKMYLSTNNYSQAQKSIEKIQNKSPELMLAYQRILYSRGVQSFVQSNYKSAISFFDKSLKISKDKSYNAKSLYWKAESYYRIKIYKASIDAYKLFLTSPGAFVEPNYNQAYYNIGYAYFKIKNYEKANANFRIFAHNLEGQNSEILNDAYNRIGDSYFIRSKFLQAVNNYDKAIEIGKRDIDYALYKKAQALGPLGNYQGKANAFEQLLKDYPNSTYAGNAEFALAQTYYRVLKNYEKANLHYNNIVNKYPAQTNYVKKAKLDLGYLYNNNGETDKAIAVLKDVYEDYKGSTESKEALKTLQGIYTEQGNVDAFFTWVESKGVSISISVQDSANYYVAENLYMDNNCEKAIKSFEHYVDRFPTGYFINNAHYYKADCEYKQENYANALIDYQFIIDRPVSEYTEKSLKRVSHINYDIFKDYIAAKKDFIKLKSFSESKENVTRSVIGIMRCDWNTESYDSVLISAQNVLKLPNIDAEVQKEATMYIAKVNMQNQDWDKAVPYLEDLTKYIGTAEGSEAMYDLAFIQYEKQDYDSAEALAYAVIQQEPSYEYWVVKSFILSADIFVKGDKLHQAKATLSSIIDNYNGDETLIKEAKRKLKKVEELLEKVNKPKQNPELIIDFGADSSLFIDNGGDDNGSLMEELEEEEDE